MIISPCISICKMDYYSGYCKGCARTDNEKKLWKSEETLDEWKKNNIIEIQKRMTVYQKKNFTESYEFKKKKWNFFNKKKQDKKWTKVVS